MRWMRSFQSSRSDTSIPHPSRPWAKRLRPAQALPVFPGRQIETKRYEVGPLSRVEEHTGIEPAPSAWEADTLPLRQCSICEPPSPTHTPADCLSALAASLLLPRHSHPGAAIAGHEKRTCGFPRRWRARPDSNRLPHAVPACVLPTKHLLPMRWPADGHHSRRRSCLPALAAYSHRR